MDWQISIGIFILVILALTVFKAKYKGDIGELSVAFMLKDLDEEKYRIIHNIKLKNTGGSTSTTQIDHIVISTYGIFVIETKGYKGKIYGKEKSRTWSQYLSNQKNNFMNPIFQNYAHIRAIEDILNDTYPDMIYYSIVAFSGEANIDSIEVTKAKVCKIRYVSEAIKDLSIEEVIGKEDIGRIIEILEKNKSHQTDFAHTREIKEIKKEKEEKIKANICPKCGGKLVEREGKYGKFIGCSNFPKCMFVVSQNKKS